jgi:two-component system, LytTR family, response regulator
MTTQLTCFIVDDEPKAIRLLERSLSDLYPNVSVTGKFTFWKDALEAIRNEEPDIIFLDISMPQKSGFDLLNLLPNLKSEVVFVTAFADYALEAFNYYAAGYILKPIKEAVLVKTLDKINERISLKKHSEPRRTGNSTSRIGIPNNSGFDYIAVEDIVYIEATTRYSRVVCTQREFLSSYSIGRFREILLEHGFFNAHRSFLINPAHIKRYEKPGTAVMDNNVVIPVSKNVREDLLNMFSVVSNISHV